MENEGQKQPWALIAIAALGLALGAVALIVAFGAKDTSEDAAKQASVAEVQTELSNLIDRLGIAEETLKGKQQEALGRAKTALRESESTAVNLSNRVDRLERRTAKLKASERQNADLAKDVGGLENQVADLREETAALNKRVTRLTRRLNAGDDSGGKSAP